MHIVLLTTFLDSGGIVFKRGGESNLSLRVGCSLTLNHSSKPMAYSIQDMLDPSMRPLQRREHNQVFEKNGFCKPACVTPVFPI